MNRLARLFAARDRHAARQDAYGARMVALIDRITLSASIRYGTRGKRLPA